MLDVKRTKVLELNQQIGIPILEYECSPKQPFIFGEEYHFLQVEPPYTVVTQNTSCIVVEFQSAALIKIVGVFSAMRLDEMRQKLQSKLDQFQFLFKQKKKG